jgi:hypothetical protein
MARKTKHEQAQAKAASATALFTQAHNDLADSVVLSTESEQEHREAAEGHIALAEQAAEARERNERVRVRLAELLS